MMIEQFELVRYFSGPSPGATLVTKRKLLSSDDALTIARDRLENELRNIDCAVFRYFQDQLHIELQTNPNGYNETICLIGSLRIPETIIAQFPGRRLTDVIQGSRIIEEVIGDRIIADCYHCPQLQLLRVSMDRPSGGWWFKRGTTLP